MDRGPQTTTGMSRSWMRNQSAHKSGEQDLDSGDGVHTASDPIWRIQLFKALNISCVHKANIMHIKSMICAYR